MAIRIDPGAACVWGTYNTSSVRRTSYEAVPVSCIQNQIYLTSLWIKINPNTEALPTDGVEIYILDTVLDRDRLLTSEGTIDSLLTGDTRIVTVSDLKLAGEVFGYDPPAEEIVKLQCDGDFGIVSVIKGRPFNNGLSIVFVNPTTGLVLDEVSQVFVDARFAYHRKIAQAIWRGPQDGPR